jgi:hypothetical protein
MFIGIGERLHDLKKQFLLAEFVKTDQIMPLRMLYSFQIFCSQFSINSYIILLSLKDAVVWFVFPVKNKYITIVIKYLPQGC